MAREKAGLPEHWRLDRVCRVLRSELFSLQDFGDGGAFPEIHMAQFPLGMGKKKTTSVS